MSKLKQISKVVCAIIVASVFLLAMLYNVHFSSNALRPLMVSQKQSTHKDTRKSFNNGSNASVNVTTASTSSNPTVKQQTVIEQTTIHQKNLCSNWILPSENTAEFGKPQVELDSSKFIYPGLIWGPNNQLVGLYQSVYLAIRLNRTLVIPPFRAHGTIGGGVIPSNERIDVARLCKFVSCTYVQRFREICKGSFDVAFQAQVTNSNQIKRFEKETGMAILHIPESRAKPSNESTVLRLADHKYPSNIPAFPPASLTPTYSAWIESSAQALRKVYNTAAPCAIFTAPFDTIKVRIQNGIAVPIAQESVNPSSIDDGVLMSAVVDAIRRPSCIVEAAKAYAAEAFAGLDYIGVHWRYDMVDWGRTRCIADNQNKYYQMCLEIDKIIPDDVASGINAALIKAKYSKDQWKYIYIAAPPVLSKFVLQVKEALGRINPNLLEANTSLSAFLKDKFKACWMKAHWKNEQEIFALIEMEMLMNSKWFFFSAGSTFSSNVTPLRVEKTESGTFKKKFGASVFQLARDAMLKRTGLNMTTKPGPS